MKYFLTMMKQVCTESSSPPYYISFLFDIQALPTHIPALKISSFESAVISSNIFIFLSYFEFSNLKKFPPKK